MRAADDEDLAAAVLATTRRPIMRLRADWNGNDDYDHEVSDLTAWVADLELESELNSDLPSEATLIEGYAASSLQFTLSGRRRGDTLSAAEVFSPYRTDSPLWRTATISVKVTLELGFATTAGRSLLTVFTGYVRSIDVDSETREVSFEALDRSERLRAPITLPSYGQIWHHVVAHDFPFTVNSQWVVDYILRRNGIYASPPPRSDAQLSVTGHGSLVAEVGRNSTPRTGEEFGEHPGTPPWIDGPSQWGMLAAPEASPAYQEFFTRQAFEVRPGRGFGIGMWLYHGDERLGADFIRCLPWPDHDDNIQIAFGDDGGIGASLIIDESVHDSVVVAEPDSSSEWRYVGWHVRLNDDGSEWTVTVRMDGETSSAAIDNSDDLQAEWLPVMQVTMFQTRPWSNVQLWYADDPPDDDDWPGESHTSQADIDRGRNELTHLPDISSEDSWDVLTAVAAAEFARIGFDETGRPYFRRRSLAPDSLDPVRTVTTAEHVKSLAISTESDSVRNVISWTAQPGYFARRQAGENENRTVALIDTEEPGEFETPPGVHDHDVALPAQSVAWSEDLPQFGAEQWEDDDTITHGFVPVLFDAPETTADGVYVSFSYSGGRRGTLHVRNFSGERVQFRPGDGDSGALRVRGWQLQDDTDEDGEVRSESSIDTFGERGYELDESDWRQDSDTLETVATGLLAALSSPVPTIDDVDIVGDPRLELGDVIRLRDPAGLFPEFRAHIVKIATSLSASDGLSQTIAVRPIAPPAVGILDDDELGILDDTMVLGF